MFSLVLVTKNMFFFFFFQMDLPVPNSASPRSLLMWVNFPTAPRKSIFPASPGIERGVSNRVKQVSMETIWILPRSQVALISFLPWSGSVFA